MVLADVRRVDSAVSYADDNIQAATNITHTLRKSKLRFYSAALDDVKSAVRRLAELRQSIHEAKSLTSASLKLLQDYFGALTESSNNQQDSSRLHPALQTQEKKKNVKYSLSLCLSFREIFIVDEETQNLILDPNIKALSIEFLNAYVRVVRKRDNLQKVLESLKSTGTDDEVRRLENTPVLVLTEQDELVENAKERLFTAVQSNAEQEKKYINDRTEITLEVLSDELIKNLETVDMIERMSTDGMFPNGVVIPDTMDVSRVSYFTALVLLREDTHFSNQNILAVATMRSRILSIALKHSDTPSLHPGVERLNRHKSSNHELGHTVSRSLSYVDNNLDATAHMSNIYAAQLQFVKDERKFGTALFKKIFGTSSQYDVSSYLNLVFGETYLATLKSIFIEILPNIPRSFYNSEVSTENEEVKSPSLINHTNSSGLNQNQVLRNPLALFDQLYLTDFYLRITRAALGLDQPSEKSDPTVDELKHFELIKFINSVRELLLTGLKVALDMKALLIKETPHGDFLSNPAHTSQIVLETVQLIKSMLVIFEQHIIAVTKQEREGQVHQYQDDPKILEVNDLINRIYYPLLNHCRHGVLELPNEAAGIMILNSIEAMRLSLASPLILRSWFPMYSLLESLREDAVKDLVKIQFDVIAKTTGLDKISFSGLDTENMVTDQAGISSTMGIISAFVRFNTYLAARFPPLNLINCISSRDLRFICRDLLLKMITDVYESAYKINMSVLENGVRNPAEVKALLLMDKAFV